MHDGVDGPLLDEALDAGRVGEGEVVEARIGSAEAGHVHRDEGVAGGREQRDGPPCR